jgi:hypothetical protein
MKLYWARYTKNSKSKYLLLLELGRKSGKILCLDTGKLSPDDKEFLRAKSNYMDSLNLDDKIRFLRDHRASAISAYKTINMSNIEIDRSYEVNSARQKS